jgi:hypothetical protein
MGRKPKEIDFEGEWQRTLEEIKKRVGQQVPLSCSYVRGVRPILVDIVAERATLQFPNGAILQNVPLRDLVDDQNYWK